MPKVRCKYCAHFEDGKCTARTSGGKNPSVKANSRRSCNKYKVNPIEMAKAADKEYDKRFVPKFSPTWRYYASKKELKELGEEKGPRYVRTNPDVSKLT